jgi:hypothetical protein
MSFLDARVAPDGHAIIVEGSGAVPLPVPLPSAWYTRPITLGLRAEGVHVAAGDSAPSLRGTFDFSEELGSHAVHHVQINGIDVLAQGISGTKCRPGPIAVDVTPGGVHLFEPTTGARIEALLRPHQV